MMSTAQDDHEEAETGGSVGPDPPIQQAEHAPESPQAPGAAPPMQERVNRLVPEAVSRRYLHIGQRYFFPDRTLAFIDTGARLKVRTHNLEVIHSVVAIMQARGWRTVQVTGTQEFRKKLWHEATLRGIGVQGYEPGGLELQHLQRAVDQEQVRAEAMAARNVPDAARTPQDHEQRQPEGVGPRPPMIGVLLAHAPAPYQFDPTQRLSYYVRVRTATGERTLWGSDLERALAESRSGVQVGDEVELRQHGKRAVTVRVPQRNNQGELVGEAKLVTQRNVWRIEKVQYLQALNEKAAMFRNGSNFSAGELVAHPELTAAMASMKLAQQFAQRVAQRAENQDKLAQVIRSGLASALAEGREIKLPYRRVPEPYRSHVPQRGRPPPAREQPDRSIS